MRRGPAGAASCIYHILQTMKGLHSSVGIVTDYGLDYRMIGFYSRRGLGIFLFTTMSIPALGLTQPPIQQISGVPTLWVNRPGREADHSPPSSADVKEFVEIYLYSPSAWLNTGITLPSSLTFTGRSNMTFKYRGIS
jgi:hypothetical protein